MLPGFAPEPLRVVCDTCAAEGFTFDYEHPDRAVECACCLAVHDHAGLGCRPVTIYGTAHLRLLEVAEVMDAPALAETPEMTEA